MPDVTYNYEEPTDTADNWALNNPTFIHDGIRIRESDTGRTKITVSGQAYNDLPYDSVILVAQDSPPSNHNYLWVNTS